MSALQDVQDRVQGFEAGGVDFISKPFQEKEVLARVRTHMNLRNMRLNLAELVEKRTAELARGEARYRGLVEKALVGVFKTTLDGRFTFVNDAMAKMFDFDNPETMIAQRSLERWRDPKDRERMLAELQQHGSLTNFEAETITHTDRHFHVLFSAKQVGNDIVESALITMEKNKLHFDLPDTADAATRELKSFEEMEREYILKVLKAKDWKIEGKDSASSIIFRVTAVSHT